MEGTRDALPCLLSSDGGAGDVRPGAWPGGAGEVRPLPEGPEAPEAELVGGGGFPGGADDITPDVMIGSRALNSFSWSAIGLTNPVPVPPRYPGRRGVRGCQAL